ncbi:MAG: PepSY domain-containing protein [Anaerolineae bacterium]|nr:PepSY domain-containing protein [Anaerolineae bacterium]
MFVNQSTPQRILRLIMGAISLIGVLMLIGLLTWLMNPALWQEINAAGSRINPLKTATRAITDVSIAAATQTAETQKRLEQVTAELEVLTKQVETLNAQLQATAQAGMPLSMTTTPLPTVSIGSPSPTAMIPTVLPTAAPTKTAVVLPVQPSRAPTVVVTPAPVSPQPTQTNIVSAQQAADIAMKYRPNTSVRAIKLERRNTGWVYEVKLSDESKVYVDTISGRVVYAEIKSKEKNNQDDDD